MSESIAEISSDVSAQLVALIRSGNKYCDYGSVMGITEEIEDIENTLERNLINARVRIGRLRARIKKWEDGNREVETIK